jgi:hypothetical protein
MRRNLPERHGWRNRIARAVFQMESSVKPSWRIFVALVLLASPAMAQDDGLRSAAIGGAGTDACSAWTADRDATSESARQASQRRIEWVSGFFSAVNLFTERSGSLHGSIDDRDGMLAWIDDYCRKNPKDPLFAVSANLVFELRNHPRK